MIRPATDDDLPDLLRMGRRFHGASGLSRVSTWDALSFSQTADALLSGGILLVAEKDGRVVGMAGCVLFPMFFNMDSIAAQEVFWWAESEGLALIDALERAAKARGASLFIASSLTGLRDEALAKLYERRGYIPADRSYIKRL